MARIGLVLGAGGPIGHAYHSGTLAALAAAGWDARKAELVVGTSIGAVTGALLRGGLAPGDLMARVEGRPLSAEGAALLERTGRWPTFVPELASHRRRLGRPASPGLAARLLRRPWRARPGLVLAALTPVGTVPTAPIATAFSRLLGDTWPAAALRVCAVDLDTGGRVVFGDRHAGVPVGVAVAASSAVPSLFQPVTIGGRRYVDGGLHSPVNADVVADALDDLDVLVVSAPMAIGGRPGRAGVDIPGRVANHRAAWRELRPARDRGRPVVLFEPGPAELALMHYNAFDVRFRGQVAAAAFAGATARASAAAEGRDPALASVLGC